MVKSLADDIELEPLIEGIPDILWGPEHRRYTYEDHIQQLLRNPDLQLLSRIADLLSSCNSGLLSLAASKRRQIICYKALWAIASIQSSPRTPNDLEALNFSQMHNSWKNSPKESDVQHYWASAMALMNWSTFCWMKNRLAMLETELEMGHLPDFHLVKHCLQNLEWSWFDPIDTPWQNISDLLNNGSYDVATMLPKFTQAIEVFSARTPHALFFNYLFCSSSLESSPYHWEATQQKMFINQLTPFSLYKNILEYTLEHVVYFTNSDQWANPTKQWIDTVIETLVSFWLPDPNKPKAIPLALIHYLNERNTEILESLHWVIVKKLWIAFPATLFNPPVGRLYRPTIDSTEDVMTALWHLACEGPRLWPWSYQSVLEAVTKVGPLESPVTFSVLVITKALVVSNLDGFSDSVAQSVLPADTAIINPAENYRALQEILDNRKLEAHVALLAEFMDSCSDDFVPYKAVETLQVISSFIDAPRAAIHESHQLRLASGIEHILGLDNSCGVKLLEAIISWSCLFDLYVKQPTHPQLPQHGWLENAPARMKIKESLMDYMRVISSTPLLVNVQAIIRGLDFLHNITREP
ncbi:hypothetical protein K438DRAFT_1835692 [Mycena galopus ATCC 62051]|nr:hypothetical protein K438DRAFT_1835692 [Mycena galopus ATCC 62051]